MLDLKPEELRLILIALLFHESVAPAASEESAKAGIDTAKLGAKIARALALSERERSLGAAP